MSCRCKDITNCQNDIGILNDIVSYIGKIDTGNEMLSEKLKTLSETCSGAFTPEQESFAIIQLQTELTDLNKETSPLLISLKSRVQNKITDLNNSLASLKREDHDHHTSDD